MRTNVADYAETGVRASFLFLAKFTLKFNLLFNEIIEILTLASTRGSKVTDAMHLQRQQRLTYK